MVFGWLPERFHDSLSATISLIFRALHTPRPMSDILPPDEMTLSSLTTLSSIHLIPDWNASLTKNTAVPSSFKHSLKALPSSFKQFQTVPNSSKQFKQFQAVPSRLEPERPFPAKKQVN
jgi:hypothetical protein